MTLCRLGLLLPDLCDVSRSTSICHCQKNKMMDIILRLLHCLFLTPLQTPLDQNTSLIGTMTYFVVPKVKLLWVNTKSHNLMAKHAAFISVMNLMAPCLKGILMYPASVHMEFQSSYEVCHVIYVGGSSSGLRSEYMKSLKLDNPVVLVLMSETMVWFKWAGK